MSIDLSVCIVAYRNYDDIICALESLFKYTSPSLSKKIYIVDNSCYIENQMQREFVNRITQFSEVEYYDSGKNLGFGQGHNYILDKIESKYHCIMNPDIVFCEDAFMPIVSYLDSNQDTGMVIPNIVDEDGKRQMVYREEPTVADMFIRMFCKNIFRKRFKKHTLQYEDFSKPFQVPFGQGSFLVIRTELFKDLGGFDDNFFMYLEDADLCKRVNAISKLMYIPDPTIIHKWEQGSHKSFQLFKIHITSMRYYFKKWGYKFI